MRFLATAFLLLQIQPPAHEIDVAKEPHHVLLLNQPRVRVFRLTLKPGEPTLRHTHTNPYAFVSLHDATISNEVRGHPPVITKLPAREVHTSKGGFSLVERNTSDSPAELTVIESINNPQLPVGPVRGPTFVVRDTLIAKLFGDASMRAYALNMFPGGFTEPHDETSDRLILAITDLQLEQQTNDQTAVEISMKPGDVRWIPKGTDRSLKNTGKATCLFYTFEFN